MQDLESSNWVTLRSLALGNSHICKRKFHVCYHFLGMKIPGEKIFINPFCHKHPKIINESLFVLKVIRISLVLVILFKHYPAGNYMFKVNNRNTRTRCEICSKLTTETPERLTLSNFC